MALILLFASLAAGAQPTLICTKLNENDMARYKTGDFVRDKLIDVLHAVPPVSNEHIDSVYVGAPNNGMVIIQYLTGHCIVGVVTMSSKMLTKIIGQEV